jgi:hypothetical protein
MGADRLLLDETRPTIAAIAAMNRKEHEGIDLIFNGAGKPIMCSTIETMGCFQCIPAQEVCGLSFSITGLLR